MHGAGPAAIRPNGSVTLEFRNFDQDKERATAPRVGLVEDSSQERGLAMLFTTTSPERQDDHIPLFFSPDDAWAARQGHRVHRVAAHYDGLMHRLIPLPAEYREWTIPAEHHGNGFIIARGPIPISLFVPESGRDESPIPRPVGRG